MGAGHSLWHSMPQHRSYQQSGSATKLESKRPKDIEQQIRKRVQSDALITRIVRKLGEEGLTSIPCASAAGTFFQDCGGGALQGSRLLCPLCDAALGEPVRLPPRVFNEVCVTIKHAALRLRRRGSLATGES